MYLNNTIIFQHYAINITFVYGLKEENHLIHPIDAGKLQLFVDPMIVYTDYQK